MSKGSERRPARITSKEFESNWEKTFAPPKEQRPPVEGAPSCEAPECYPEPKDL